MTNEQLKALIDQVLADVDALKASIPATPAVANINLIQVIADLSTIARCAANIIAKRKLAIIDYPTAGGA